MITAGEFPRDLEGGTNLLLIVSISGDALKISGSSMAPPARQFPRPRCHEDPWIIHVEPRSRWGGAI